MEVKVSAYRQSLTDPAISSLACQALLTMVAGKRLRRMQAAVEDLQLHPVCRLLSEPVV
jgi:hypothetical protein